MYVFVQVVIDTNLDDPLYPLIKQHFSSFFYAGKHVEGLACANHTQYRFREHGEKNTLESNFQASECLYVADNLLHGPLCSREA